MQGNIMKTQILHVIKYDLKGHERSLKALLCFFLCFFVKWDLAIIDKTKYFELITIFKKKILLHY